MGKIIAFSGYRSEKLPENIDPIRINLRETVLLSIEEGFDTFIRYSNAIPILKKVKSFNEETFNSIVSARKPFGLPTNFNDYKNNGDSTFIKIYGNKLCTRNRKSY